MGEPGSAGSTGIVFAQRRPGWELPECHAGLQLHGFDELDAKRERQTCPKWYRMKLSPPPSFFNRPPVP